MIRPRGRGLRLLLAIAPTGAVLAACSASGNAPREPRSALAASAGAACPSAAEDPALPVFDSTAVEHRARRGPDAPAPRYPEALRAQGVTGRVEARWIVQRDGCVDQASIEIHHATDERFARELRRTLRTARFVPAQRDGAPVRQWMAGPVVWDLQR